MTQTRGETECYAHGADCAVWREIAADDYRREVRELELDELADAERGL